MKTNKSDKKIIIFSSPEPMNNVVFVSMVHPDYTKEIIGKIYPNFNTEENSIYYTSTNLQGEEIFPPNPDFTEIETRFKQYAKEQSEKSLTETMIQEAELQNNRKNALQSLRNLKFRKLQFLHLFKSF
jgi:hypothetical protein